MTTKKIPTAKTTPASAESAAESKGHCSALLQKCNSSSGHAVSPKLARSPECLPMLEQVTAAIRVELETLERTSAYIGLRVGICMELGKRLVKHGSFEDWYHGWFDYEARQLKYFHALARKFIAAHEGRLAYVLPEQKLLPPADGALPIMIPEDLEAPAREFVGDASLADLLDKYGIKKKPTGRPRGGDHGGGAAVSELAKRSEEWKRQRAEEDWDELVTQLRAFAIVQKRYLHLSPAVAVQGVRHLKDVLAVFEKVRG